jgi:hypothetical protein
MLHNLVFILRLPGHCWGLNFPSSVWSEKWTYYYRVCIMDSVYGCKYEFLSYFKLGFFLFLFLLFSPMICGYVIFLFFIVLCYRSFSYYFACFCTIARIIDLLYIYTLLYRILEFLLLKVTLNLLCIVSSARGWWPWLRLADPPYKESYRLLGTPYESLPN